MHAGSALVACFARRHLTAARLKRHLSCRPDDMTSTRQRRAVSRRYKNSCIMAEGFLHFLWQPLTTHSLNAGDRLRTSLPLRFDEPR